jgi:hypothetical protein
MYLRLPALSRASAIAARTLKSPMFLPVLLKHYLLHHVQLLSFSLRNMASLDLPRKANYSGIQAETQVCLIMVGLPARGKSLIAGKGMLVPRQSVVIQY